MAKQEPVPGKMHKVREGEWMTTIGFREGFIDWEKIWNHPKNQELRQHRKSPNLLVPKDHLFIPERSSQPATGETEQEHCFQIKSNADVIRLRLFDEDDERIAEIPYTLTFWVNGGELVCKEDQKTDGSGIIEEPIPPKARAARLALPLYDVVVDLVIGALQPIDSSLDPVKDERAIVRGVHQRLLNLFFTTEPLGSAEQPRVERAVRAFQQYCQDHKAALGYDAGSVDGHITPAVRKALMNIHDDNPDY